MVCLSLGMKIVHSGTNVRDNLEKHEGKFQQSFFFFFFLLSCQPLFEEFIQIDYLNYSKSVSLFGTKKGGRLN